jgi:SH3-like domain-containing protein
MKWGVLAALFLVAAEVAAAEFRSVAEGAVTYDAPSLKANKLFILQRDYPVEVVVAVEGWAKVRDASGTLAWVERKALADKRTVLVRVDRAEVRDAPSESAPVAFHVARDVVLEFVEYAAVGGWIKVAHRDGQSGFLRASQVWGG